MRRLLLLLSVISISAMADGIDDPRFYDQPEPQEHTQLNKDNDPNYWSDFDKHPCNYPIWPPGFICRNPTMIEYIPNSSDPGTAQIQTNSVPEPHPELLLLMGIAALLIKTRLKK